MAREPAGARSSGIREGMDVVVLQGGNGDMMRGAEILIRNE
jgi:hypothetical protein